MRDQDFAVHYYEAGETEPHRLNPDRSHRAGDTQLTAEDVLTEVALRKRGYRTLHYPTGTRWVPVFRVQGTETWLELSPRLHPDGLDMAVFDRALAYGRDYADTAAEEEAYIIEVAQADNREDAEPFEVDSEYIDREPVPAEEFDRRARDGAPPF